jgi:CubicO group peptidase (beta-lactamase class C family)
VAAFLARPVECQPGTYFVYNSGATYMLSAIVQKLTGMTLLDYLTPHLFTPLGIQNPTWESCPRGINVGGWGLSTTTLP